MEYAISLTIVIFFAALYAINTPKLKIKYYDPIDDADYKREAEAYVQNLLEPKSTGKVRAKKYIYRIKFIAFCLKSKKYDGIFDDLLSKLKTLKTLLEYKYDELTNLPSVNGDPRAVLLAGFILGHNRFRFDKNRVDIAMEAHNRLKTLCFSEIENMNGSFCYVLLEALCGTLMKAMTLAKVYKLVNKYVISPYSISKRWEKLAKSPLFLSLCALKVGYKADFYKKTLDEVLENLNTEIENVSVSFGEARSFDFSSYYTPLEILDKYDVFHLADAVCKKNFLNAVANISDRENLDEFMLTIRLDKYMHSASGGHMAVKRLEILGYRLCMIHQKKDISMLAAALSSRNLMQMFFGSKNRKINSKSISKVIDFENTFEPIYKFNTLDFGISTVGDRLRLSPHLPSTVTKATAVFTYNGIENTLCIVRGDDRKLYLGDMELVGTDEIHLGGLPLKITVMVPYENKS